MQHTLSQDEAIYIVLGTNDGHIQVVGLDATDICLLCRSYNCIY